MIEKYPSNLDVRVVPFTATACSLFGGATMCLIDFENPRLPTVGWQETVTAWGIIDDQTQVGAISTAFTEALQRSLDGRDSKEMIRRRIEEI
jgi:hypothetical protein